MELKKQPTRQPTRKMLAVIIAGIFAAAVQTTLVRAFPGYAFAEVIDNIDYLAQGLVMAAAGYFTRERADE